MSIPLNQCLAARAAKGDEEAYQEYANALRFNLLEGHFCMFPCEHKPHCGADVTQEQVQAFEKRLQVDVYDRLDEEVQIGDDEDDNFVAACLFCRYLDGRCRDPKPCLNDSHGRCQSWRYYKDAE
jgi:hypothetical protein